jgi:hypothetical protein
LGPEPKASSTYRTRTCLLVQARSQHDFAKSARRSGLAARPYGSLERDELDELMATLEPLATLLLAAQD